MVVGVFALAVVGSPTHNNPVVFADPYGLFSGVWHGLTVPITIWITIISWLLSQFEISLFADVTIWGTPNTGLGYWLGFVNGMAFSIAIWD